MTHEDFPEEFTLEIEEVDRQKASRFDVGCKCLLATCATRTFPGVRVAEGVDYMCFLIPGLSGDTIYSHTMCDARELHADPTAVEAPFYKPEVVGLKIKCTKMTATEIPFYDHTKTT
jgi:hypothetical protein